MQIRYSLLLALFAASLTGCDDRLDDDYNRIEKTFSYQVGSNKDYYIGYNGLDSKFVHVGVIYGQVDDKKLCEEFVKLYNNWKKTNAYACKPAN